MQMRRREIAALTSQWQFNIETKALIGHPSAGSERQERMGVMK